MDQEMMQLKHELKEFVEKANHILQKMDGSMGQRFYGMRGGSGYGNSNYSNGGGSGGGYGNREPWMQGGYSQQEQWPNVDPRWFM
jgi:uncharacterized membrane protein